MKEKVFEFLISGEKTKVFQAYIIDDDETTGLKNEFNQILQLGAIKLMKS